MADPVNAFSPVRQERRHEVVARQLRASILAGSYQPGDRLPKDKELIETFQVSRSAIRHAIGLLEQQGLVTVRVGAGGGAFVSNTGLTPILDAFTNLFALGGIDAQQFIAAKGIIEPAVSATAAEMITEEQLAALRENLAATEEAVAAGDAVLELSLDFHRIIAAATDNPVLELVLIALIEVALHMPGFREPPRRGWKEVLRDHHDLYEALAAHSPERVHELITHHLESVSHSFA